MASVTKMVLQINNSSIMKLSTEMLAKANVLTHKQMSKIYGGECYLRCDQNAAASGDETRPSTGAGQGGGDNSYSGAVDNCDRSTVSQYCASLNNAVCCCSGGEKRP